MVYSYINTHENRKNSKSWYLVTPKGGPRPPLGVTKYQLPQTKQKLYAYDYVSVYVPCYYVTCHIKSYLSCHALKIKSTQIIFKQETPSNIIWTLTIHKQTSLNFDYKKYIILAQTHSISITVLHDNHPCQDIRKSFPIQLIFTNTNCFYKIIIAKLLALNVLSIALYTLKISTIIIYYKIICHVMHWK